MSVTRQQINRYYLADEASWVADLINYASLSQEEIFSIRNIALDLVKYIKQERLKATGVDSFMSEYSLSSLEGIVRLVEKSS